MITPQIEKRCGEGNNGSITAKGYIASTNLRLTSKEVQNACHQRRIPTDQHSVSTQTPRSASAAVPS